MPGLWIKVRQELPLFWYKPPCFPYVDDAVLMLISRKLHYMSSVVSIKTRSTPDSLSLKDQETKHNCKMVYYYTHTMLQ